MSVDLSTLVLDVRGDAGIAALDRYTKSAERSDRASRLLDAAAKLLTGSLGALGALDISRRIIALSDAYTAMNGRLAIATRSTSDLAAAQGRLFTIAQDARQRLEDVTQLYTRLSIGAKELGASQNDLFRFTEGVGKALLVTGTSGAQASGALLQLSQAVGSGIVRAEEFNSVLEGAPRILQAVADGYGSTGVSIAQLRTKVLAGQVTSKEFFEAFLKGSEAIKSEAATIPATVGGAITLLQNALLKYVGESNTAREATSGLSGVIRTLADNVAGLAQAATVVGVVLGAKLVGSGVEQLTRFTAGVALARAETVAYAEDAVRTASANKLAASSELDLARARQVEVAETQRALLAERELVQVRISNAANRLQTATAAVANPVGSGFTQAEALAAQTIAQRKLNEAVNEAARLGKISQSVNATEVESLVAVGAANRVVATTAAAASVAQTQFAAATALASRAMAGAVTIGRGLLALVGGIPGLVLIAGYALYQILTDTSKQVAELDRRSELAKQSSDAYAKSLDGLSAKALAAAEAQERLNLAQAASAASAAGGRLIAARDERVSLGNRPGGPIGKTGDEARAEVEYSKALDALSAAAARVTVVSGARTDAAKREAQATQTLTDEYKKQHAALAISLERQRALNGAGAAAKVVLDEINAKYALKGKLSEIDAQYTGQQAAALKGLATALSDAERKQSAMNDALSVTRANDDRVRLAEQSLALAGLEADQADVLRVNQKAINDEITARRDLSGQSLRLTLDAIEAERTLEQRALQVNRAMEGRKAVTKKLVDELNESLKESADLAVKAVAEMLETLRLTQNAPARRLLESADKLKPVVDNFVRDFQSSLSTGFDRVFSDGLKSWQSFFDSVKQMFVKLAADIAASQIMKRAIAPLTAALFPSVARAQNPFSIPGRGDAALGTAAASAVGFGVGYGVGNATGSKLAGAASGALSGAVLGAQVGGPVGAAIGGVVGAIGGLLGASRKGTQQLIAQTSAQEQLNAAMVTLRATFSNDALGQSIAQATAQFSQLRQQTEAAYAGKKNEAERNKILAELNTLEAKRVQILNDEYAAQQQRIQQDDTIRKLIADGKVTEADAAAFAYQQERELADLRKSGADATTIAGRQETLLAEARKRAADLAEADRRRVFDITNDTRSIADPRGAAQAAFDEEGRRRYDDAVARGASALELAAIAANTFARAVQRAAEIAEADTRVTEGLMNRVFSALGNSRATQDAATFTAQRQEIADAVKDGMTPSNLALLRFTQFVEREQIALGRRIEDGTKAIQAAAAAQIAAVDTQIAAEQARVAQSQAWFDGQIQATKEASAAQIAMLDTQRETLVSVLDVQRAQLQAAEEQVRIAERAYEALSSFSRSLSLSDAAPLSPTARLEATRAQFEQLARDAQGGNADAAANIPAIAQALLDASRTVNASGAGYAADFARVQQIVDALTTQYGGRLGAAQSNVAQWQGLIDATQAQIDAIDANKAAIQTATDKLVGILQAGKEADKTASDALLEKLGAQKQAISDGVQAQIDQLVKVETEAFNARVEASAYYSDWRRLAEQQAIDANAFYAQAAAYFTGGIVTTTPQPVVLDAGTTVQTSDPELKNVITELKALVVRQDEQIGQLKAQVSLAQETAKQTIAELQNIRESVTDVSGAIRRASEGGQLA